MRPDARPPAILARPLRIAQVAPLWETVPPARYGGTERVVSWLTEELVARGHDVTLFATGDSQTGARLIATTPRALRTDADADPFVSHVRELGMVQDRADAFDVIHSHLDILGLPAWRSCPVPIVSTLHGRLNLPGLPELLREFDDQPLVSISDAQRAPAPDAHWAATVHHGLPLRPFIAGPGSGDYVVFLGRISPEKRPDAAIRIARRAGIRLVIAAKVDRVDREYFAAVVEPMLREPGVDFVGEVDDVDKVMLLRDARALLFPILWPEPFGLAMIEALACGTPVLTRRCGSTPEIVDDPRIGVVADDDAGLVSALGRLDTFDRGVCRAYAERRFAVGRMADDYEALYRRLAGERTHDDPKPIARLASA